jgi:hypothetical protein
MDSSVKCGYGRNRWLVLDSREWQLFSIRHLAETGFVPPNLPPKGTEGSFPFLSRVYKMLQQEGKKWDSVVVSRSVETVGSQKKDGNIRMFATFRQNGRLTYTVKVFRN